MSSYIKKTSSDFFVPTERTGKVLAAGLRFLPDALFCFPMDREGNIVDVKVEGCILSEMREMLAAIAPWVREGSYLSLFSDDGSRWRRRRAGHEAEHPAPHETHPAGRQPLNGGSLCPGRLSQHQLVSAKARRPRGADLFPEYNPERDGQVCIGAYRSDEADTAYYQPYRAESSREGSGWTQD